MIPAYKKYRKSKQRQIDGDGMAPELARQLSAGLNNKEYADIHNRHRKWPLGTVIKTMTPYGYLLGTVFQHYRLEKRNVCAVEFELAFDKGDGNGKRFCHDVPFRSLRRMRPTVGLTHHMWKLNELYHNNVANNELSFLVVTNNIKRYQRIIEDNK